MVHLSDRRPKVAAALEALHITSAEAHQMPLLSAASKEDLFALPDAPLTAMTPEELVRFAQIVDTALFKCYLLIRPGLLVSLCRVTNWCEVSEVEEVLRAREVCPSVCNKEAVNNGLVRNSPSSSTCITARRCTAKR